MSFGESYLILPPLADIRFLVVIVSALAKSIKTILYNAVIGLSLSLVHRASPQFDVQGFGCCFQTYLKLCFDIHNLVSKRV